MGRRMKKLIIFLINGGQNNKENKRIESLGSHYPTETWLFPEYDRNKAINVLNGRPNGTFLIRKSRDGKRFALSVMCDNNIGHCIIEKGDRGFGFAEPVYASLSDLVVHYSKNSLEEHNDKLRTKLLYPVGLNSHPESAYIERAS
ncbi:PIK3R1_2_3 [Lepeophtheirus salmonis]|uniref:PIK3R1_2_3 n=1 Tax=Lepeophtheirus salmonis TaxID=72036 RepID=A0A7R8CQI7_LEPSM|nr:PIK3R1_2_3 [Lepeophtheirus salmonis]CAF2896122.1 PIK3R1_2_3 [Lepeophtheirus salmonis]